MFKWSPSRIWSHLHITSVKVVSSEHLNTTMSCLEKVEPVYFGDPQGGAWSIDSMNLKVHPFRSALDIGVVVQATVAMLR